MMSGSMEPVETKNFVVIGAWWRVEVGDNHAVKKVS